MENMLAVHDSHGSRSHSSNEWSKCIQELYLINKKFDTESPGWKAWIKGITNEGNDESAKQRRMAFMEKARKDKQARTAQIILGSAHRVTSVLASDLNAKDLNAGHQISSIEAQVEEIAFAIDTVNSTPLTTQQIQCINSVLASLTTAYVHTLPASDIETFRKTLVDGAAHIIDDVISSNDLNDLRAMLASVNELEGQLTSSQASIHETKSRFEKCKREFEMIMLSVNASANEDILPVSLGHQVEALQNARTVDHISSPSARSVHPVAHYIRDFMKSSQGANLTSVQQNKDILNEFRGIKARCQKLTAICSSAPTVDILHKAPSLQ